MQIRTEFGHGRLPHRQVVRRGPMRQGDHASRREDRQQTHQGFPPRAHGPGAARRL